VIGGALLLWDWREIAQSNIPHMANNCRANYVNMSIYFNARLKTKRMILVRFFIEIALKNVTLGDQAARCPSSNAA